MASDREMAVVIAKIVMNQGHSAVLDSVKKKEASPLRTRRDYGSRTAGISEVELAVLRLLHHRPGHESWQVEKTLKRLTPGWAKYLGDVDVRGVNLKRVVQGLEARGLIEEMDQGGMDYRGQEQEWWPLYLTSKGESTVRQHGVRVV